MELIDPISAYNAESNMDAEIVRLCLESNGIKAFVTEDNSVVGLWAFGTLPEIHKPQVWISKADSERAARLIREHESKKSSVLDSNATDSISAKCEDCNKESTFPGSENGTTQVCPCCGAYIDVGEFEWPMNSDNFEEEL